MTNPSIILQAFEAAANAETAQSTEELNALAGAAFEAMGFSFISAVRMTRTASSAAIEVLFGVNQEPWVEHYREQKYARWDAVLPLLMKENEPFFWSEVPTLGAVTPNGRQIFNEAAEFGLHDGLVTPIRRPDGAVEFTVMSGDRIDPRDTKLRLAASLLAQRYMLNGRRLLGAASATVTLSERQREVLLWVREGKSSTDIGDILTLSARTVDAYIAAACKKLGVRTRHQAAAEAAALGLFAPPDTVDLR